MISVFIFLFIFGSLFAFAGIAMAVTQLIDGNYAVAAIAMAPAMIGLILIAVVGLVLYKRILNIVIVKKGKDGIGYFENSESGGTSGNPRYIIDFSYGDEDGIPQVTRTLRSYSLWQIRELQQRGMFGIKIYKGRAAINLRALDVADPRIKARADDFCLCAFCGTESPVTNINCNNCGGVL